MNGQDKIQDYCSATNLVWRRFPKQTIQFAEQFLTLDSCDSCYPACTCQSGKQWYMVMDYYKGDLRLDWKTVFECSTLKLPIGRDWEPYFCFI